MIFNSRLWSVRAKTLQSRLLKICMYNTYMYNICNHTYIYLKKKSAIENHLGLTHSYEKSMSTFLRSRRFLRNKWVNLSDIGNFSEMSKSAPSDSLKSEFSLRNSSEGGYFSEKFPMSFREISDVFPRNFGLVSSFSKVGYWENL